eukprot:31260-Pelagococcus_subviridis.AAC.21
MSLPALARVLVVSLKKPFVRSRRRPPKPPPERTIPPSSLAHARSNTDAAIDADTSAATSRSSRSSQRASPPTPPSDARNAAREHSLSSSHFPAAPPPPPPPPPRPLFFAPALPLPLPLPPKSSPYSHISPSPLIVTTLALPWSRSTSSAHSPARRRLPPSAARDGGGLAEATSRLRSSSRPTTGALDATAAPALTAPFASFIARPPRPEATFRAPAATASTRRETPAISAAPPFALVGVELALASAASSPPSPPSRSRSPSELVDVSTLNTCTVPVSLDAASNAPSSSVSSSSSSSLSPPPTPPPVADANRSVRITVPNAPLRNEHTASHDGNANTRTIVPRVDALASSVPRSFSANAATSPRCASTSERLTSVEGPSARAMISGWSSKASGVELKGAEVCASGLKARDLERRDTPGSKVHKDRRSPRRRGLVHDDAASSRRGALAARPTAAAAEGRQRERGRTLARAERDDPARVRDRVDDALHVERLHRVDGRARRLDHDERVAIHAHREDSARVREVRDAAPRGRVQELTHARRQRRRGPGPAHGDERRAEEHGAESDASQRLVLVHARPGVDAVDLEAARRRDGEARRVLVERARDDLRG